MPECTRRGEARGRGPTSPPRAAPAGGTRAARRTGLPSRCCQTAAREPAPSNRSAVVFGVPRGGALLYSPIESAKLAGVGPRAYLREATLRAVRNPATVSLARDLK